MHVTEEGLALIKRFEGFRSRAYRCPAGVWTVGYGHTAAAGPPEVRPGMVVDEAEADRILRRDVAGFAEGVRDSLSRDLSAAQFSALVSFAYNVGLENLRRSSVLRAANAGDFDAVPHRLMLWTKANGRTLSGLARRRAAEGALFAGGAAAASDARSGFGLALAAALLSLLSAGGVASAAIGQLGWVAAATVVAGIIGAVLWFTRVRRRDGAGEDRQ